MKRKPRIALVTCLILCALPAGCGGNEKGPAPADVSENRMEEIKQDEAPYSGTAEADPSHYSDADGNEEFYIMEVVPFGDNLYAQCGQAMAEDSDSQWIKRNYELMTEDTDQYLMYGPALSGAFEVGLEDSRITAYYGSYWWD